MVFVLAGIFNYSFLSGQILFEKNKLVIIIKNTA